MLKKSKSVHLRKTYFNVYLENKMSWLPSVIPILPVPQHVLRGIVRIQRGQMQQRCSEIKRLI